MRLPSAGVDISKDWFDAAMPQIGLKSRFEYTTESLKKLLKLLKKHGIDKARFCMEATGLYYERLAEFLHAHGYEVVVVNPQCIKHFAKSELRRSKTDPLDAELIQLFCEQKYDRLHLWQPTPEDRKAVREILRRRQALIEQRTAEKNRKVAGFSSAQVRRSIEKTIQFLNREIEELEAVALKIIASSPEMTRLVNLISTIPGVGVLTAIIVLVEVPEVLWTGRLAAVFAGVIPSKRSSGKSRQTSYLSKVGSSRLRHAIYMPALTAARCNPVLRDFYERLLKRGLHKMQALTAVMRKLLHLIFGIVQTGKQFDAMYEHKRRALALA